MGSSSTGDKYILLLKDDHYGYCWLYHSPSTSSDQAAHALLDWCAAFSIPTTFMSDVLTNFKNETIRLLTKILHAKHYFTLSYCPWSNSCIKRLGKEVLLVARSLLSELQLGKTEWIDLVPLFQSATNNSPSPQRKNVAPISAFTGRPPTTPLSTFLVSQTAQLVTISEIN